VFDPEFAVRAAFAVHVPALVVEVVIVLLDSELGDYSVRDKKATTY